MVSRNPNMAIPFKASFPLFLCFIIFCGVNGTEFEVGGKDGWVVPKSKDDIQMYNQWASQNRFKVNDTLLFKYKKDSVMEVTEEEFEKCKASRPLFFSNNGDTVFKFDRPGLFYFISGVSGHCDRGERMIIKVLDLESAPSPQSANETAQKQRKSGVPQMTHMSIITTSTFCFMSILVHHLNA